MRSIRLFTDDFAIVDFNQEGSVGFDLIKLFLELDTESPMYANKIKSIIACDCAPVLAMREFKLEWLSSSVRANLDENKLHALDYTVSDGVIARLSETRENRLIVPIADSSEMINAEANNLKAIAKLFLLSKGNINAADMIPEITVDGPLDEVSMTVVLPVDYKHYLETYDLPTEVRFDTNSAKESTAYASVSIPAHISSSTTEKLQVELAGHDYSEIDILRCMVAGPLMSSLLSYRSAASYQYDFESLRLTRNEGSTYSDKLAEAIMSGKVRACPYCGNPILMLKESSSPFCRSSHQTRYSEEAKSLLKMGASKEEIVARFPFINKKTILNW